MRITSMLNATGQFRYVFSGPDILIFPSIPSTCNMFFQILYYYIIIFHKKKVLFISQGEGYNEEKQQEEFYHECSYRKLTDQKKCAILPRPGYQRGGSSADLENRRLRSQRHGETDLEIHGRHGSGKDPEAGRSHRPGTETGKL